MRNSRIKMWYKTKVNCQWVSWEQLDLEALNAQFAGLELLCQLPVEFPKFMSLMK
jgi:hypothetical protein